MINKETESTVDEIVEGYFQGENLTELIQAGKDNMVVNNLKTCFLNLKG